MTEAKLHAGGCHCGKVRYEVTAAVDSMLSCNCSICSKKGTLLTFVPEAAFTLKSGESDLTDYQFNKHRIHHTFCRVCGVTSFARGTGPDGKNMIAINARCLDDFDPATATIKNIDGKSF